jgi:hypothetical protein
MFLRHARPARFAAAFLLLFTATLVLMAPKVNAPETPFDEASTVTNEIVIQTDDVSSENQRSHTATSVPKIFAESRMINVRRVLPVYAGQLSDSRRAQQLLCTLLC